MSRVYVSGSAAKQARLDAPNLWGKRCPTCDRPLLPDGRCEHWEDHAWNDANAESFEADTAQLWRER